MESVTYTEHYLATPITANQNNLANDVFKLCPQSGKDGEMVGLNMTHTQIKNKKKCTLQGAVIIIYFIVKEKKL